MDQSETTRYVVPEGVSLEKSYLNKFYHAFWADIFKDWEKSMQMTDLAEKEEETAKLYDKYSTRFVTEYAATNPGEDIAESFTIFVTKPKPTGTEIKDKKVLFFYGYPEMVELREEIRKQL